MRSVRVSINGRGDRYSMNTKIFFAEPGLVVTETKGAILFIIVLAREYLLRSVVNTASDLKQVYVLTSFS